MRDRVRERKHEVEHYEGSLLKLQLTPRVYSFMTWPADSGVPEDLEDRKELMFKVK
jgi:hypothetical protein